jgi:DNA gyrase/topoisomerase IV subunit B
VNNNKNKVKYYALDEAELESLIKKHPKAAVTRFKGLGEMNDEELGETAINANTRNLVQVKIEDLALSEKMFSSLMGDKAGPRKEYLINNATKYFGEIFLK